MGMIAVGKVAADTIYLKSGGRIEGKIVYDDGKKIKVRTAGRATLVYDIETDVEKIEYDEKTGDDYLKRKSGVKGGKATDPFRPRGQGGELEEGENPYKDETEVTEEEELLIKVQIRNLKERQDNRYLVRAKNRLVTMGKKAGRFVLELLDSDKPKVRLRAVEILREIGYKPAVPDLISKALGDENPFTREAAIQALTNMTGEKFGFRAYDPGSLRAKAIEEWKAWWVEEEAKYLPEEPEETGEAKEGEKESSEEAEGE